MQSTNESSVLTLSVLGVDEPHVLTICIQSLLMFSHVIIPLLMLVFELIECITDMLVVVVDELSHGVHGVGVINAGAWPPVTVLLEEDIKHVGVVQHHGSEVRVGDVVVVVVRAQQSVVALHLVVDRNGNQGTIFRPQTRVVFQPHCVLVHLKKN